MKFTSEISLKIRTAIKVKLAELGNDVYEELPDYIMVMVANRKSEDQMTENLSLFLGDNTEQFTSWLHSLLSKLQSVASVPTEEKQASVNTEKSESAGGEATTSTSLARSDSETEHSREDASCAIPSSDEASKIVLDHEQEKQPDSQKNDNLAVDHADSTSRGSNNERSLTHDDSESDTVSDSDTLKTENPKTENGTPEKGVKKRKKHSVTRVFRVKSRKFDSESDSSKSNSVGNVSSDSNRMTEHGSDGSDSEKETKSYTQIRRMKQNNNTSSEVSSSILKTEKVEGEDLVQRKENDSAENNDLVDSEETEKSKLNLKLKRL